MPRAQVALWFAESFGLKLETLTVSEMETGIVHNLSTEKKDALHRFDDLLEDDKSKLKQCYFFFTNFVWGTAFTMCCQLRMMSCQDECLIKQRRGQLNNICYISSTPDDEEGAQVPFREILTERIRHCVGSQPNQLTRW